MRTYTLEYGGRKETVTGINLKGAVESLGFKVEDMYMKNKVNGRSSGNYVVHCVGGVIIYCTWIEKIKRIKNAS